MFDDDKLAVISAEINGGEFSPTNLRFNLDVNTFPTVSASVAAPKGDVSVQAPTSKETLARIAKLQKQRLAGRTEPDFKVTAEDGRGGEMDYEGFIAAPILYLTKSSTTDKLSSVGKVAVIDALDLSIYAAGYELAREEAGSDMKPLKSAKNGNVPKVISDVTDALVANYDAVLAEEYMEVSKEMLRIQHTVNNSGPLELWEEILANSDVKYDSWNAAFKASPAIARALTERVRDFLEAQNSGFWMQIQSMMSSFRMFYVPEFNGVGKFVRADKKMGEPEETLSLSVSSLSVADGSSRILQPGGVVMMSRGATTERQESQPDPSVPRVVAYAPDPLLPGFIHREPPPFWLVREEGVPIFGSEVSRAFKLPSAGGMALDLIKRAVALQSGRDYKKRVDTVSSGIMTELCEVAFKELQLEQSTVAVGLPLDYSMSEYVGKRVTVKITSGFWGGGKFTAFVSGVTHSVDLQQGKQLSASTELRFSHVEY